MSRRWIRILLAIGIGVLVTAITAAVSFAMTSRGAESAGEILLWPNTLLQVLVPAPNIGTPDHPLYEGTPLNFFAFLASFPLAITVYGVVAYVCLCRLKT
jgi:hypothetical protein